MRLVEAREIIHEVHGKGYSWLKDWGLSYVREAIRTIYARVSATPADLELAEGVERRLSRKW